MTIRVTNKTQFDAQLADFIEKAGGNSLGIFKKIAFDAFSGIAKKTPVDTGRARNSWNVAVNRISTKVPPKRKRKSNLPKGVVPPEAVINALKGMKDAKLGDTIYISSNLSYIVFLEEGRSKEQAPEGMVKVTLEELRAAYNLK